MAIIPTYIQFKIIVKIPSVYLEIIPSIPEGTYFPITADKSGSPILFLINVNILSNISNIATKNTNDENLLKNITTNINKTINTIKSIYIKTPLYFI